MDEIKQEKIKANKNSLFIISGMFLVLIFFANYLGNQEGFGSVGPILVTLPISLIVGFFAMSRFDIFFFKKRVKTIPVILLGIFSIAFVTYLPVMYTALYFQVFLSYIPHTY